MSMYGSYDERIKVKREREERAKFLDSHPPSTDKEAAQWRKERGSLAILLGSSNDQQKSQAHKTLDELQAQKEQAQKAADEGQIVDKVIDKLKEDGTLDDSIPTW